MNDIVIVLGLALGVALLIMGATGKKEPPPKSQKRECEPLRKMRIDAIADAAHARSEEDEVRLIRAIARDLKRKRFRRNHGKTSPK